MPIITIDAKEYDLDSLTPEAREHAEQLLFLFSDVAKLLSPSHQLQARIEASRKAFAQALAPFSGDTIKLG